jgi:hypothetical protein
MPGCLSDPCRRSAFDTYQYVNHPFVGDDFKENIPKNNVQDVFQHRSLSIGNCC